jgi:hypothetical protein
MAFFAYRLPLYNSTYCVELYNKEILISSSATRAGHFGISEDTKGQKLTCDFGMEYDV